MCGISGMISSEPISPITISRVEEMNNQLHHRGPDSSGLFSSQNTVMSMRRLSIIDVEGGAQPLFDQSKEIVLVCNGEIYNHVELRSSLLKMGYEFSSKSDVETIIYTYLAYGDDFISHLQGMFAFALWDARYQRLILARDRLGEKPLYYYIDKNSLWFSSEITPLVQTIGNEPKLTPEAFNLFLTFQYIPEPITPINGFRQLPAGHFLSITPNDLDSSLKNYWNYEGLSEDPIQPVEKIKGKLANSCKLMGSADVPVAVALSGGIDSSLVTAITSQFYHEELHAFTIGYSGRPASDERDDAAKLASLLKIKFTPVELTDNDFVSDFPAMMSFMDTPIADIAAYGYFAVSRAARSLGFPVLLSGLGGDEFFWGYKWVKDAVIRNEAYRISSGWQYWVSRLKGKSRDYRDFFEVHSDLRNGNKLSRQIMTDHALAQIPEEYWLRDNKLDPSKPTHISITELLNRTWLRSNCLALADRMSMGNSVEIRLPLLDNHLVDTMIGMRNNGLEDWKMSHKALLVKALQNTLPTDVLNRKKQGFTPPVWKWMRAIIKSYQHYLLDGHLMRNGLLDYTRFQHAQTHHDIFFQYKLVFLECWCRIHLDAQGIGQT